ncbi:MAG: hypothetical protein GTN82_23360 [Candidatus Aminicenantes bacterium]|nr:hypothetical protein [Candidatus Aminicenantes bacterium]
MNGSDSPSSTPSTNTTATYVPDYTTVAADDTDGGTFTNYCTVIYTGTYGGAVTSTGTGDAWVNNARPYLIS